MQPVSWDLLPLLATQSIQDTFFRSVSNCDPVGKGILFILILFSLSSWTVMIGKWITLSKAKKESDRFLEACKQSSRLSQGYALSKKYKRSPLSRLYKVAYAEVQEVERMSPLSGASAGTTEAMPQNSFCIDTLQRVIDRTITEESALLEKHVSFLATCTTVCPFLGLFGTVWGILVAFQSMANSRTADVATVTPGISAALVTTIGGLVVAIPAVMGYNGLLNKIDTLVTEMELLGSDIVSYAEKRLLPRGPS